MHRTYKVLRSAVLLAAWRTVSLPSEFGAGLHVDGSLQSLCILRICAFPRSASDNGCRPFTVVNTSDYTQNLETMYLFVDGFHATEWYRSRFDEFGDGIFFNRSRAFTLVQYPNPGAKTAGYWSTTLCW